MRHILVTRHFKYTTIKKQHNGAIAEKKKRKRKPGDEAIQGGPFIGRATGRALKKLGKVGESW